MKDPPPAFPTAQNSQQGVPPPWLPEARHLASACHRLATRVDTMASGERSTDQTLQKTGHLLHVIGDSLDHAITENTDGVASTDPVELSLNLIQYARALPQASTTLWNVDTTGATADFGRSLPDVSMALMTLSQQVNVSLPCRGSIVRCKH